MIMKEKFAVIAGGTVCLVTMFAGCGNSSMSPEEILAARTDFANNPSADPNEADQTYVNIPGNEFVMRMTSEKFPNGHDVLIDPDDMVPYKGPETKGQIVLMPRDRFPLQINEAFPEVPGAQIPPLKPGEATGVRTTATYLDHLTAPSSKMGHGIPIKQVNEAMRRCYEPWGIPIPE